MSGPVKIPASLEQTTVVERLDALTYAVDLSPSFCIGTVPNGGYVATAILKVANIHLASRNQIDTIAAHWQYLGRTRAGRAIFTVEESKLGRSTSVLHISLYQDGLLPQSPWVNPRSRCEVTAYITNGNLEAESGVSLPSRWSLDHPPPEADLTKLSAAQDPNWERLTAFLFKRVPSFQNVEYYSRRKGHALPTTQDFWIRMAVGEPFTTASLGYVVDSSPALLVEEFRPPTRDAPIPEGGFAYNKGMWYPTVVMSLDVKKRLPPGGVEWLRTRVSAKAIRNGRFDVEVIVFDTSGDLVALSHHVAMAVDVERNYADRQEKGKI